MIKKLFVTAAAAAAVSVPLAGVAWADPPADPDGSNSNGIGAGGVPGAIGNQPGGGPEGPGVPVPPGSQLSQLAKDRSGSVPDVINETTQLGRIGLGPFVKVFTPGCGEGNGPDISGAAGGCR
jgi:hypothetical protein